DLDDALLELQRVWVNSIALHSSSALEVEAGLAGGIGQGLDAAVVLIAAAVEDHLGHAGVEGALRHQLTDDLGLLGLRLPAISLGPALLSRRGGGQGMAGHIVDHLGVDMLVRAEDVQPRALRGAGDALPQAVMPPDTQLSRGSLRH